MPKRLQPAVAYLRTSRAANVGVDKTARRGSAEPSRFSPLCGVHLKDEYYDVAVSGADHIDRRPDRCCSGWPCTVPRLSSRSRPTGSPATSRYNSRVTIC
jgi:hypothetical protein